MSDNFPGLDEGGSHQVIPYLTEMDSGIVDEAMQISPSVPVTESRCVTSSDPSPNTLNTAAELDTSATTPTASDEGSCEVAVAGSVEAESAESSHSAVTSGSVPSDCESDSAATSTLPPDDGTSITKISTSPRVDTTEALPFVSLSNPAAVNLRTDAASTFSLETLPESGERVEGSCPPQENMNNESNNSASISRPTEGNKRADMVENAVTSDDQDKSSEDVSDEISTAAGISTTSAQVHDTIETTAQSITSSIDLHSGTDPAAEFDVSAAMRGGESSGSDLCPPLTEEDLVAARSSSSVSKDEEISETSTTEAPPEAPLPTRRSARDRRPPTHVEDVLSGANGHSLPAKKSVKTEERKASTKDNTAEEEGSDRDAETESSDEEDPNVYCICRGKDDGRKMVYCDACEEWYHYECLNLDEDVELEETWVCFTCESGLDDLLDEEEKTPVARPAKAPKQASSKDATTKAGKRRTSKKPAVVKKEAKRKGVSAESVASVASAPKPAATEKKRRTSTKRKSIEMNTSTNNTPEDAHAVPAKQRKVPTKDRVPPFAQEHNAAAEAEAAFQALLSVGSSSTQVANASADGGAKHSTVLSSARHPEERRAVGGIKTTSSGSARDKGSGSGVKRGRAHSGSSRPTRTASEDSKQHLKPTRPTHIARSVLRARYGDVLKKYMTRWIDAETSTRLASEVESCLYELYNSHLDKDYKLHIKRLALNFSKNASLATRLAEGELAPRALVRLTPEELGNKVVMHARQKVIEKAITNSTIEPSTVQLVMNNEKDADRLVSTDVSVVPAAAVERAATPPPSAQPPRRHSSVGSDGALSGDDTDVGGAEDTDSGDSNAVVQRMLEALGRDGTAGAKRSATPPATVTAPPDVGGASPQHLPSPTGVGMSDDEPYDPDRGVAFDPPASKSADKRAPPAAKGNTHKQHSRGSSSTIWEGVVQNGEHTQMKVRAVAAYGRSDATLRDVLPGSISVLGRILPKDMWKYISSTIAQSTSKEVVIARLAPGSGDDDDDDSAVDYVSMHSYFHSRRRCGVIGCKTLRAVKDIYLVPVSASSPIPDGVARALGGQGLQNGSGSSGDVLVAVVVKDADRKRKRTTSHSSGSKHSQRHHSTSRSHAVRSPGKSPLGQSSLSATDAATSRHSSRDTDNGDDAYSPGYDDTEVADSTHATAVVGDDEPYNPFDPTPLGPDTTTAQAETPAEAVHYNTDAAPPPPPPAANSSDGGATLAGAVDLNAIQQMLQTLNAVPQRTPTDTGTAGGHYDPYATREYQPY
eukprot:m.1461776 g.1461776  ORF g.1461776 m.1461776 type:complete len:1274 (-) comp25133_c2_seq2:2658-6479(-)